MSDARVAKMATGGEAVVESLVAHGVSAVFGIPGTHNLAVYEALAADSGIRHVLARHEQGAGFMADGHARATGDLGVCLSTTGPAALNVLTPLGTAFADSVPVLSIASEIPVAGLGRNRGYLHECRDQLACYAPVTGYSARVTRASSIGPTIAEAVVAMRTGRPRPAAIDIPCDLLDAQQEIARVVPGTVAEVSCDAEAVARAAELLAAARRPLIWAGGGVIRSRASAALVRLAETLDAPVFCTVLGKGALPADHRLAAGEGFLHPAALAIREECDVLLAVGTGLGQLETCNWELPMPPTLIQVDIDAETIGHNYPVTTGIVGDAAAAMDALSDAIPARNPQRSEAVATMKAEMRRQCRERCPQVADLVEAIRRGLPRETVLVNDLTIAVYWGRYLLDVYEPNTYLYPWNFCTLGYGLPAAIGAAVARSDVPVVAMCGDGGFLFNVQELATAVQQQLPLTVVVFNDSAYGVLKPQQQQRYGRTFETDLHNPDLVALAGAFGADGMRAESHGQLETALGKAIASDRVTVIDVPVSLPWPVWPRQEVAVVSRETVE